MGVVHLKEKIKIDKYKPFVDQAKAEGAEMVVFPELAYAYDTFSEFEQINDMTNPYEEIEALCLLHPDQCIAYKTAKKIQYNLSKWAKDNHIYIAFNLREKGELCTWEELYAPGTYCVDGYASYNTDLVLDRTGKIIVKYRKANIFFIFESFKAGSYEPVTFNVDFTPEKFGIITCFDLLNQQPLMKLLEDLEIKNLLFPTQWDDVKAGYEAGLIQQGMSYAYDLNLYASDICMLTSASGIFSSGVPLNVTTADENVLLTAEMSQNMQKAKTQRVLNPSMTIRTFFPFLVYSTYQGIVEKIGHGPKHYFYDMGKYTCDIKLKIKNEYENQEYFRIGAGSDLFVLMSAFDACGVYDCGSDSVCAESAMTNVNSNSKFEYIKIEMKYKKEEFTGFTLPALSTKYLMVPLASDFFYNRIDSELHVRAKLDYENKSDDVLSRCYIIRAFNNPDW
jgi:predicted amidohydrolase